MIIKQMTSEME